MGAIVYILCTLTSLTCAVLLFRGYRKTRFRLLFWSALCFIFFAVSNALLFADLILFPDVYILPYRGIATLSGLAVLIYGLIFESN